MHATHDLEIQMQHTNTDKYFLHLVQEQGK